MGLLIDVAVYLVTDLRELVAAQHPEVEIPQGVTPQSITFVEYSLDGQVIPVNYPFDVDADGNLVFDHAEPDGSGMAYLYYVNLDKLALTVNDPQGKWNNVSKIIMDVEYPPQVNPLIE